MLLTAALLWAGYVWADGPRTPAMQPLDCVINPSEVADLGSGVPGILSMVRVDRSDLVRQGEVVAELESSVESVALELARARAAMDAEVDLRRVNAAFGQRQQQRTEDLYQRQVISTNDLDQRKTEASLASIQLRQARENQQLAQLEQQRAEQVLNRRTIHSPISGVVMERFKTIGEYVEDQPVVRVAQLDPLHVEVFVPVEHLGQVQPGMQAEVISEAVTGARWTARVSRVDRVADVASGTYGVRLELPNPDYKIPAGLRCQVAFVDTPAATEQAAEDEPPVATVPASPASAPHEDAAVAAETPARRPEAETPGAAAAEPVSPAGNASAVTVDAVAQLPRCQWAGPFADEAAAQRQARALKAAGFEVEVEPRTASVRIGHRVLSKKMPTRAAAEGLHDRLRSAGFTDLYLAMRGEFARRVALGLYKNERPARQRVETLAARGFEAELLPWLERRNEYFLAVRGMPNADNAGVLGALPVPATDGAFENGTCDRLASR